MKINMEKFLRERDTALFSLDKNKIIAYMIKYGVSMPKNEEVFWIGVHKSIVNITTAPPEVVERSKKWLHDRGYSEDIK